MPTAIDVVEYVGTVRTTDAVATDVAGLVWTPADKMAVVYMVEADAVRENTTSPLVYSTVRRYLVAWSAGAAAIIGSTTLSELGDAAMEGALVLAGSFDLNVKVQVTGIAGTTFNWYVRVTRRTWSST